MASPTYRAVYKCRLCGEVFDSGARASFHVAAKETRLLLAGCRSTLHKMEIHACTTDGIGVADFQGWMEEGGDADG